MKFQKKQNARMFFVQWLFANKYSSLSNSKAFELFSFTAENFDYELFDKLQEIYYTQEILIKKLLSNQTEVINECILSLGICEIINGTESALVISECLQVSDLFCNNSKYLHSALEKMKKRIIDDNFLICAKNNIV